MENASKALLIAGAILLVIALIAIGMAILNTGDEVTNAATEGLNTLSVQSYNQAITPNLDRELNQSSFNNLKSIALSVGMTIPAASDTWQEVTAGPAGGADIRVGVRAVDYVTAADVTANLNHPGLGRVVTREDIGKIVAIEFYNVSTNAATGATWRVNAF